MHITKLEVEIKLLIFYQRFLTKMWQKQPFLYTRIFQMVWLVEALCVSLCKTTPNNKEPTAKIHDRDSVGTQLTVTSEEL